MFTESLQNEIRIIFCNVTEKVRNRLIVYEVCVTLASSTQQYYSFIYFNVVFSVHLLRNIYMYDLEVAAEQSQWSNLNDRQTDFD